MISKPIYTTNGRISNGSISSDDGLIGSNILEENGRVSLAYENLSSLPKYIAEKLAEKIKFLDLSYNKFTNISFLVYFDELHTLILDRNYNLNVNTLPLLPNLKILWVNNCNLNNIADWIERIRTQCPALEHLSLMGNPGIEQKFNLIEDYPLYTNVAYNFMDTNRTTTTRTVEYKEFVLELLTNLQYLDGMPCSSVTTLSGKYNLNYCNNNGRVQSSPTTATRTNGNATSHSSQGQDHGKKFSTGHGNPNRNFKNQFRSQRHPPSSCSSTN